MSDNLNYPLIPLSEITDEARKIAVAWVDGYERQWMDIPGKQKLASDIMNYAKNNIIKTLNTLTDDERFDIFNHYCTHCGSKDTSCQCWNDE